jgi:hypothetical protein
MCWESIVAEVNVHFKGVCDTATPRIRFSPPAPPQSRIFYLSSLWRMDTERGSVRHASLPLRFRRPESLSVSEERRA